MLLIYIILNFCLVLNPEAREPIHAVATIGQIADIVKNIGSENINVQRLIGPGVDPHLYSASESDMDKLSSADIIFYNGLSLESKMEVALQKMGATIKTVPVSETLPVSMRLEDQTLQGQHDPHIWFDVTLWILAAEKIRDELIAFAPELKDQFSANADAYIAKLKELHEYVHNRAFELTGEERVLVTTHDAFRYLGRAYDFEAVGLHGITTQSSVGAEEVARLADFIVERKVKMIFVESSIPAKNLRDVQEAVKSRGWDVAVGGELFSDNTGSEEGPEGAYIGMMTYNIDTIVNSVREKTTAQ